MAYLSLHTFSPFSSSVPSKLPLKLPLLSHRPRFLLLKYEHHIIHDSTPRPTQFPSHHFTLCPSLSLTLSLSPHKQHTLLSHYTVQVVTALFFFFCAGEEKTVCQTFRGGVTLAHAKCVAKHACVCMCMMKSVYWGIPLKGRSCNCV